MTNNYYTKSAVPRLVSARALQINNNLDLLVAGFDKFPDPDRFKERNVNYIADTGAANAYVVAYPQPAPSAYAVGMTVDFVPGNANSGASTINVNSLGNKSILDYDGNALTAGMLATGRVHTIKYDGTAFRLTSVGTTLTPSDGTVDASKLASSLQNVIDLGALSLSDGDILFYNSGSLQKLTIGSVDDVLKVGAGPLPAWGAAAGVDVQEFTASGTWNEPTTGTTVEVWTVGGGGGGGAGRLQTSSGAYGGLGGNSGTISYRRFSTSELGSSETVTIGAGGAGATAQSSDDTDGDAGSAGGDTTFGSHLRADGGQGGPGGASSAPTPTSVANYGNVQQESLGGTNSADPDKAGYWFSSREDSGTLFYINGGASGARALSVGGDAGKDNAYWGTGNSETTLSGGTAGGGTPGADGVQIGQITGCGGAGGGAGGRSGSASAGGAGGDGARGAGGGGGGASQASGYNSGAGGDGGDGYCLVITY